MNQFPWPDDFGRPRTVLVANPAAAANFVLTVETNSIWAVQSVFFALVNAAVAATRRAQIRFTDGSVEIWHADGTRDSIISETGRYSWSDIGSASFGAQGGFNFANLPSRYFLNEGDTIESVIANMQAGDQISEIRVRVLEWLHPII